MEQSSSWEDNSCSSIQEIPCFLWDRRALYRVHKNPPLVYVLSQMNPVQTHPPYCSKVHSVFTLSSMAGSTKFSSLQVVFVQSIVFISHTFHACYMPLPSAEMYKIPRNTWLISSLYIQASLYNG